MRHGVDGRKFGRNTSHRVAMLRNLANSLILEEQVITTVQKAKEARRVVERLVSIGKRGEPHVARLLFDRTRNEQVVTKIVGDLAKRYGQRAGGYTRVLKMSERRWGDAAEMACLELVDRKEMSTGRRASKAASEGVVSQSDVSSGGVESQAPSDPFKRFRKLFQKSTKSSK